MHSSDVYSTHRICLILPTSPTIFLILLSCVQRCMSYIYVSVIYQPLSTFTRFSLPICFPSLHCNVYSLKNAQRCLLWETIYLSQRTLSLQNKLHSLRSLFFFVNHFVHQLSTDSLLHFFVSSTFCSNSMRCSSTFTHHPQFQTSSM